MIKHFKYFIKVKNNTKMATIGATSLHVTEGLI